MSLHVGRVERVERLTPRMVRVVLGGDGIAAFQPMPFTDQYVNALFAPAGRTWADDFDLDVERERPSGERPIGRRYTIRSWDAAVRELSIDFVVHGDEGIAGRWAQHAEPGDLLPVNGPSGGYAPAPEADSHLLVGDESALPAIAAALEQVPVGRTAIAVLLVDGPDHELPLDCPGDLRVTWLHRGGAPDDVDMLVRAVAALELPEGTVHGFVHGEAAETRAVRRQLLGDRGLPKDRFSISPYWRRSYTDERWREVKGDWLAAVEQDV